MTTATAPAMQEKLDQPYALTPAQIEQFRTDGFIKLKDVWDAEVLDYYGSVITDLTLENDPNKNVPMEERSTYNQAFIQVGNLWTMDEQAKAFSFSKRMARIAAELLGTQGVRMWHDQALYKEPGGGFTPWHADQYYWPMASMLSVTAWIPLQPVTDDMGPLAFAKGSHRIPSGREIGISDESEARIAKLMDANQVEQIYEPFDLGEVSFHYGFTMHRAGPNTTQTPRKVHTVIYMDEKQLLIEPRNPAHVNDWEKWAPGCQVGEVIGSDLNPVLYHAD